GAVPTTITAFAEFIHPADRPAVLNKLNRTLAESGDHYYDEFRIKQQNGNVLWISSQARIIRSADGRAVRLIGVDIDINERMLAMEWLKTALGEVQKLKDRLQEENIYLQEEIRVASGFSDVIGQSEALRKVLRQA